MLQNKENQYIKSILDSMSLGIYIVNNDGILKLINKEACRILCINEEAVLEKKVNVLLPNWISIFERLKSHKTYYNREEILDNEIAKGGYNISAKPIEINNEITGMVIVFKDMRKAFKSVTKYSSGRAIYKFKDIIGDSKELNKVIHYAKIISASTSTVLIEGESGTGKELLAQAIHNYSDRKNSTFITISCGAMPKNLIEGELFGYEEGAFTGAKRGGHVGKFEFSSGGTLFLDEIGEMPLDMQVNLLRVLQEGYITRVGGNKIIPVDVRIIAATNKDLKAEVEKGNFREDLYYRLSVIPIKVPPLRERTGDLPILIRYLFRMKVKKLNKHLNSISADLYLKMLNYNWPGNIRELENRIENIVNFNGENTMLFPDNQKFSDIKAEKIINENTFQMKKINTLVELETTEIIKALNVNQHNITKVAKDLGITRATLYSKIKKYHI